MQTIDTPILPRNEKDRYKYAAVNASIDMIAMFANILSKKGYPEKKQEIIECIHNIEEYIQKIKDNI